MMDNDASTELTSTSRQRRQRRRVIIGAVADVAVIAVVVPVVLNGGLGSNSSRAGTILDGCPVIDATKKYPDRAPIAQVDWSGCALQEARLPYAYLWNANFAGADLKYARLDSANLYRANFGGAQLFGANFTDATLFGANFAGADLTKAVFTGAKVGTNTLYSSQPFPSVTFSTTTTCPNGTSAAVNSNAKGTCWGQGGGL